MNKLDSIKNSYSFRLLMLLFILLSAALLAYDWFCLGTSAKKYEADIKSMKKEIVDIARRTDQLTNFIIQNSIGDVDSIKKLPLLSSQISLQSLEEKIIDNPIINDAYNKLQSQYEHFSEYINLVFIVLSFVLTLFTIAMPIMNYNFFQKEHIARLNKQINDLSAEQNNLVNRTNSEMQRLNNAIEQTSKLNEDISLSGGKGITEVSPISDSKEDKAQAAYLNARRYIGIKNYFSALDKMNAALELEKKDEYYYLRSNIFYSLERLDDALSDIREAINTKSNNASYHYAYSEILCSLEQNKSALTEIDKALTLDKNNAVYLCTRSRINYKLGDYTNALRDIEEAIGINNEIEFQYRHCITLIALGKLQNALEVIDKIVDQNPGNIQYLNTRFKIHFALKQYDAALDDCDKAMAYDPNDADIYYNRAILFIDKGKYHKALDDINIALAKKQNSSTFLDCRGNILCAHGRHNEAISDYNMAIQLSPDNPEYFYNRGKARYKIGQLEYALDDFNRAYERNKNEIKYLTQRCLVYYDIGKLDAAIADCKLMLDKDPHNSELLNLKGNILQKMGDLNSAKEYYDNAIFYSPANRNTDYLYNRCLTLKQMGLYEDALKDIEALLKNDSKNEKYLYQQGLILYEQGNFELSAKCFDILIGIQDKADYLYYHGYCLYMLKLNDDALSSAYSAARIEPQSAKICALLSFIAYSKSNYAEAVEYIERALQKDPRNAKYISHRGLIQLSNNKCEEAKYSFDDAINLAPGEALNYYRRGLAYKKMTQYKLALHDFMFAIEKDKNNIIYLTIAAETFLNIDEYDKAKELIDRAHQISTGSSYVYRCKALYDISLMKKGKKARKIDAILADLDAAIRIDGKSVDNFLARAEFYVLLSKYDKAEEDLESAGKIEPTNLDLCDISARLRLLKTT